VITLLEDGREPWMVEKKLSKGMFLFESCESGKEGLFKDACC
jgi:hypothetical protein